MKQKKFIKICPECGGIDITIPNAGLDLRMTMKDYCKECGNRGNFPEIEMKNLEKIRKAIKKK